MTLTGVIVLLLASLAAVSGILALIIQIQDHLALKKTLRDMRRKLKY